MIIWKEEVDGLLSASLSSRLSLCSVDRFSSTVFPVLARVWANHSVGIPRAGVRERNNFLRCEETDAVGRSAV